MASRIRALLARIARSYVLFVVIGLVVGLAVAPVAWDATSTEGTVAVVPVSGTIDGSTAAGVSSMLQQARADPDVKAVVLLVNSGGGGAAASEELYLQTKRTTNEMPLVTSVDASAASGAYYTIAPSDHIYAKPASTIGSVGVLATTPQELEPTDLVATTGPNKLTGGDDREFNYILESLGNAFVGAVFEQRGDELSLSRSELEQARIYSGTQAVQNGMADSIGGRQAAVEHAASEAGLDSYDVRVMRPDGTARFLSRSNYVASTAPNKTMVSASYLYGESPSGPVFLMVPATYVEPATNDSSVAANDSTGASTSPARVAVTGGTHVA
ncbi:protease-4 [Haloplanus vescus]|uniref:Protease-4 n=1 Tax=Haloplanus vescus TaxID=555874 RepID=A0A1H3Y7Q9_9EURY|nr:S49 family peptidase [Haloplanus vescus]SEA06944.1 protease-4 [Haloplanus vescus]